MAEDYSPPHWLFGQEQELIESAHEAFVDFRMVELCEVYVTCVSELGGLLPTDAEGNPDMSAKQFAVFVCSGRLLAAARAIAILIGAGYVAEAYALVRRLYEINARTAWIADGEDDQRAKAWLDGRAKVGRSVFQAAGSHESGDLYRMLSHTLHGDASALIDHRDGDDPLASVRSWFPSRQPEWERAILLSVVNVLSMQMLTAAKVFGGEPPSAKDWELLSTEMIAARVPELKEKMDGKDVFERRKVIHDYLQSEEQRGVFSDQTREFYERSVAEADNGGTDLEE